MAPTLSNKIFDSSRHNRGLLFSTLLIAAAFSQLWSTSATVVGQAPACTLTSEQSMVMNFFIHDDLAVTPGSSFFVTPAFKTINGLPVANLFGAISVLDDRVTDGSNASSTEIARARGFYVFDNLATSLTGLEFVFTATFTNNTDFEGSTLIFRGYDQIADQTREIAITGGTGFFRLARGWAILSTFSLNGGAAVLNATCTIYYGCYYGSSQIVKPTNNAGVTRSLISPILIFMIAAMCMLVLRFHRSVF